MNFPRLVLLLKIFSEAQHTLKDNSISPYKYLTFKGYLAGITQVFLPILFSPINLLFSLFRRPCSLRQFLLFCPLNNTIKSSQYFYRFIDFSKCDTDHIYVQTNYPLPYLHLGDHKYLQLFPLHVYFLILRYFLFLVPYSLIIRSNYCPPCDPSAIRNLYLYFTSVSLFQKYDLTPSILSTFEGHAWEYAILLAYSQSFRTHKSKVFISYQHAPLTFPNASHLANDTFFKYTYFRKILPSGSAVSNLFKNYFLHVGGHLSGGSHIYQVSRPYSPCIVPKFASPYKFLCVPEAIDSELDLFCRFAALSESSSFQFSIRVQNIYYGRAYSYIKSHYPRLLSSLVSSDQISLLDHSSQADVCIARGSSASIECVQNGLLPIYLTEPNSTSNNVFWPIQEIVGVTYPYISAQHFLDAIDVSMSNFELISKFASSYYIRYLLE